MPDTENIRTWVEALRSGKFKQAKRSLTRSLGNGEVGFCCLGVACEVAGTVQRVTVDYGIDGARLAYQDGSGRRHLSLLPDSVSRWLGLDDRPDRDNPAVTYSDGSGYRSRFHLAELNDNLDLSFDEIADIIEREWLSDEPVEEAAA